jgi:hypothetical protein
VTARAALGALALAGALAGCGLTGPGERADRDALEDARARWSRSGPGSYRTLVTVLCFCGEQARGPVEVRVTPTAVSRTYTADGSAVGPIFVDQFPTVAQLFLRIERALDEDAFEVEATYDPVTGAPLEVYIDQIERAVDEELRWTLTRPEPI